MDHLDEVTSLLNQILDRVEALDQRIDDMALTLDSLRNQVDVDLAAIRRDIHDLEPGII
jgi:hypothetical protein